jgi:hypothetical protein
MIKEVLLFGDNTATTSKVMDFIEKQSTLNTINVKLVDQIDHSQIKSDQILIILSEHSDTLIDIIDGIDPDYTSYITSKPHEDVLPKLKGHMLIGVQRHLFSNNLSDDSLNLGAIRFNINLCEPAIRESNLMLLDMNILRKSEVINSSFAYPSGLFTEDVSQLCRYGGMSEVTKFLCINNVKENLADIVAQFIWYFSEAASQRFPDHPYFTNTVEEYAVEVTSFDTMLSFYKSKTSGRWWVKIPDIKENKWKSCSYEDYQMACNDNISPELLNIIAIAE